MTVLRPNASGPTTFFRSDEPAGADLQLHHADRAVVVDGDGEQPPPSARACGWRRLLGRGLAGAGGSPRLGACRRRRRAPADRPASSAPRRAAQERDAESRRDHSPPLLHRHLDPLARHGLAGCAFIAQIRAAGKVGFRAATPPAPRPGVRISGDVGDLFGDEIVRVELLADETVHPHMRHQRQQRPPESGDVGDHARVCGGVRAAPRSVARPIPPACRRRPAARRKRRRARTSAACADACCRRR